MIELDVSLSLTGGRSGNPTAPPTPTPAAAVIEGDSIAEAAGSFTRLWAAAHPTLTVRNLAVPGSGLAQLQARSGAALAEQPTHLFVFVAANDLGADTAGYINSLTAYTDPFRSSGTKVIVGTALPRTGVADWATKRANFNAALRAAIGTRIDDVVDFDTNPMGVTGAEADAALYPDGLHPSNAGHRLLLRTFAPVMNHWLGIANEPMDFTFAPQNAALPDTDYDSAAYSVTGFYAGESRPYAVQAGKAVSKNGGAFVVGGSGSVVNGDTLPVRNRSASGAATQTDVTLTIGTTSATYSVTTAGAGSRDWVPTDLGAKLKLWLRPEGIAGANASEMAVWPDASGNAVAVTGAGYGSKPTVVAAGLNGFKTVRFDPAYNQAKFTLPTGYLTGRTAGAAFFVAKLTADPPGSAWGPPVSGWGTDASGEFYPYTNGSVYSSYGSSARYQTADVGPSLAAWRFASFHSAAGDWRYYVDGTAIHTVTANTFAAGTAPQIGFDAGGGAMDGQIAEIIDCTAVLTTPERQRVEGYLAWKYGLVASLPTGHPYKSERPTI